MPQLGRLYFGAGLVVLGATALPLFSDALDVWRTGLPIRWTLLLGRGFVLGINAILFLMSSRFFNTEHLVSCRRLFAWCGTGYLLIALTAAIINRHSYDIAASHLDMQKSAVYRASDYSLDKLRSWLREHDADAGPDLKALSNDPEFAEALESKPFYRHNFDERFQISRKAVILGYKRARTVRDKPVFVLVRFPADLLRTLGFELVTA